MVLHRCSKTPSSISWLDGKCSSSSSCGNHHSLRQDQPEKDRRDGLQCLRLMRYTIAKPLAARSKFPLLEKAMSPLPRFPHCDEETHRRAGSTGTAVDMAQIQKPALQTLAHKRAVLKTSQVLVDVSRLTSLPNPEAPGTIQLDPLVRQDLQASHSSRLRPALARSMVRLACQ